MPRARLLVPVIVLLCLLIAAIGAYRVAVQRLHGALTQALGPRATVGAVELGWTGLTMRDLHIAASLRLPQPHLVRLTALTARLGPLVLPALDEPMTIDLAATFKGPTRDGRVALDGTLTPATRQAQLKAEMTGVAETLGVSLEGVVEGVGKVFKGLLGR